MVQEMISTYNQPSKFNIYCWLSVLVIGLWTPIYTPVYAVLYYSLETTAELPSSWRGFILDHRELRQLNKIETKKENGSIFISSVLRIWEEKLVMQAELLRVRSSKQKLTDVEWADWGAILIRLGKNAEALEVLKKGQKQFPKSFWILANLTCAWQLERNWDEAERSMREALDLVPPKLRSIEKIQLKYIEFRKNQKKADPEKFANLFDLSFTDRDGKVVLRQLSRESKAPVDKEMLAMIQRIALSFPNDGCLMWELSLLSNASGDVKMAKAFLDGCVLELNYSPRLLRQHRQIFKEEVDRLAKLPENEHRALSQSRIAFPSNRPLIQTIDESLLPKIKDKGCNDLPWEILSFSHMNKSGGIIFHPYVDKLEGKKVQITGYMQPINDESEFNRFLLIEYPIGCWFCETPETNLIVYVESNMGKKIVFQKKVKKITGILKLNHHDPEDFYYTIEKSEVSDPD